MSKRLQLPGCLCSPASQAAATGGHCSIAPARGRINCFRSSRPCMPAALAYTTLPPSFKRGSS